MGGGQTQTQLRLPSTQKVLKKYLENGTLMFGGLGSLKKDAGKVFTPYLMGRQVLRLVEFTKMNQSEERSLLPIRTWGGGLSD